MSESGRHLCHAMLLPRADVTEQLARLAADGRLELGPITLQRRGKAIHLIAEQSALPQRRGPDHASMRWKPRSTSPSSIRPPRSRCCAAALVEHPKYAGRRILGSGINLTHLYRGKIPYLWYLQRDLGFVHKFLRGVARPDMLPDDVHGVGIEKPWVAAVESFAIGGHCQILLTMDYVIAASDAYMTLPARKEGIIPGVSNMRLPRFVGDRIARQAIQYGRRLDCDSPEGRHDLRRDRAGRRDGRGDRSRGRGPDELGRGRRDRQSPGVSRRRRSRSTCFRRYCAVYAREQAYLPLQPGADPQSRAVLGRAEPEGVERLRFSNGVVDRGFQENFSCAVIGQRELQIAMLCVSCALGSAIRCNKRVGLWPFPTILFETLIEARECAGAAVERHTQCRSFTTNFKNVC